MPLFCHGSWERQEQRVRIFKVMAYGLGGDSGLHGYVSLGLIWTKNGKPIRYGRMPGSRSDVEFSPFQGCLEMSGAVGL